MFCNVRSSIWLVIVAFLLVGCGQDSVTAPKAADQYAFTFEYPGMHYGGLMESSVVILKDGRVAHAARYYQDFFGPVDSNIGGHTYVIELFDDQDQLIASAAGVSTSGFTMDTDIGSMALHQAVAPYTNALENLGRLQRFVADNKAFYKSGGYGTYGTVLVNAIPEESLVLCAMQSDQMIDPAPRCGGH